MFAEVGAGARQWPRAVTVISAATGGIMHAITATAVSIASMNPPMLTVSVAASGRLRALCEAAGGFATCLLAASQVSAAERFARPDRPADARQFAGLDWFRAPISSSPVLTGAATWFDCVLTSVVPLGSGCDQVLLVGAIGAAGHGSDQGRPFSTGAVLRVGGSYRPLPLSADAGHAAERG
jgi:flavin reductase (DIM6/NTAB) family NADH-FMN oxidoreductase RutF